MSTEAITKAIIKLDSTLSLLASGAHATANAIKGFSAVVAKYEAGHFDALETRLESLATDSAAHQERALKAEAKLAAACKDLNETAALMRNRNEPELADLFSQCAAVVGE